MSVTTSARTTAVDRKALEAESRLGKLGAQADSLGWIFFGALESLQPKALRLPAVKLAIQVFDANSL
jgi:hypothetical protein